ncbi:hypothetical protein A4A49_60522, partial [Nicotiana attenuata]
RSAQFGERISNSKKPNIESGTTPPTIYRCRDEMVIKKILKIKKKVNDLELKYQYPTIEESNEEQKKKNTSSSFDDHANNGVEVKILVIKKDATGLLLKCREGGILVFM